MCWKCGTQIHLAGPVPRDAECPSCHADVRCCRNCAFYEPGSHYDCHETVEEPVADKERANFCPAFTLATGAGAASLEAQKQKAMDARKAFDALFSV